MRRIDYARSGDLHIAFQTLGAGPIDLLAVLGYATNLDTIWEWPSVAHFFERMAAFSRFIMFDKRGMGLSDHTASLPTLEEMADDMRAVLDAVGSERTVLYGVAEGGPAACLFAATYPERTSALVLYGSYARRIVAPDYPFGVPEWAPESFAKAVEERWGREPVALRTMAPSLADDEGFRRYWVRSQRMGASPRSVIDWYRMTAEIDARGVLGAIRVPTLVVHRAGDRTVGVENGRYLAEGIPGARYVELPGDDHGNFVDPDQIADVIEEFLTGARSAPPTDRVLATVLFTDIVSSTETAARLGDRRWRELLDAHDALVCEEIERQRGRVVKNRGDGFLATFDGPARGIRAASAAAERVRPLGIEVRAGLHSGEVEVRGEDIGGIAVNIGARVADLAGPSEVLVSSTVKDLVVGSGIAFEDRGTRALKGVPDEWRVFAVCGFAR